MVPAVSVVIPLYQTERFIGETLRCVLAQTFTDFEVVVVDDGSTDRGAEIARSTGDPRVRVVTQSNQGIAGARNTCVRESRAPLIAWLDADDLWVPTKLERHVAHLAANPTVGISFSASVLIDERGHPIGHIGVPSGSISADDMFCFNPLGNGSTPVMRRAVFDAIAFHNAATGETCWFDEQFTRSEDVECWTRMATATSWRFAALHDALTMYRFTDASLSANVEKQLATWLAFRAKMKAHAPALERRTGDRAEAHQRRYLARRAVRVGDGWLAARLVTRAIVLYPRLLVEAPRDAVTTLVAAYAAALLPSSLYHAAKVRLRGRTPATIAGQR